MPFKLIHCCERCRRVTDLWHCKSVDEYLCEDCIYELAKTAYEKDDENEPA